MTHIVYQQISNIFTLLFISRYFLHIVYHKSFFFFFVFACLTNSVEANEHMVYGTDTGTSRFYHNFALMLQRKAWIHFS